MNSGDSLVANKNLCKTDVAANVDITLESVPSPLGRVKIGNYVLLVNETASEADTDMVIQTQGFDDIDTLKERIEQLKEEDESCNICQNIVYKVCNCKPVVNKKGDKN